MYKTKGKIETKEFLELSEVKVSDASSAKEEDKSSSEPSNKTDKKLHHKAFAPKLLLIVAVALLVGGAGISIYLDNFEAGEIAIADLTAKNVMVNINSTPQIISTNAQTVGDLLKELGITITNDDYMDKKRDELLTDGMKIWMRLSVPITIVADGKTYTMESQPITVADALSQYGIVVGENDLLSQPLLSYIYEETTIEVDRIDVRTETVDEYIEQPETEVEYSYLAAGVRATITEGSPGIDRNTYEVTYSDGEEISRVLLSTERIREPEERVVGVGPADSTGTATMAMATTDDGASFYYKNSFSVEATAYTWTGNTTATGTWPKVGTIAVDPDVIPLGSKVYVSGYGFAVAEDTGGAINNNIIDLYMDTYEECIQWGRRQTTIYILE